MGAPGATAQGGSAVSRTGLIFDCPVAPGNCDGLTGDRTGADNRLFDTEGKFPSKYTNRDLVFQGHSVLIVISSITCYDF